MTIFAQGSNSDIQIELVAENADGEAIVHVRLPRGQTVEEAVLTQGDNEITLIADPIPLPITQFIVLDASDQMVNMQEVVQSNVPRLWNTGEQDNILTSLIFFDSSTQILPSTSRLDDINNQIGEYTINSGEPACLGAALTDINNIVRDFDRSWRILIVTVGDFSRITSCAIEDFPTAPTLLDIIAITDEIDPNLQILVDDSGGQFYTANLRLVEARTNAVLAAWSQPSYLLRGDIPDGWDSNASFEFDILISNDAEASEILTFREYNVPVIATPTTAPLPTETSEQTAEITELASTQIETSETSASADQIPEDSNNVAILLIVGAILFVIGAVVLALALSQVRRAPAEETPSQNPNFYETLDSVQPENDEALSATRVRERAIVSSVDAHPTEFDDTQMAILDEDDNEDTLLVTQVLSDERFRSMMEQAISKDEIVGWMRLIVRGNDDTQDYELTARGAVVGRSQECDIQITGDRAISRKHARLDVRVNGQVTISRLSAVNPVIVGGIQISNRHPLAPNDVIHLSDETRLIFIANEDLDDEDDLTQF